MPVPSPSFTILICPACGEGVEVDHEGDPHFHTDWGGYVEPVEVDAVPDQVQVRSRVALARFRLQEDCREAAFRQAEQDWYRNLSVADRFWEDQRRIRRRRESLAAMRPFDRTMAMLTDTWMGSAAMTRQLFSDYRFSWAGPRADELDRWLAADGPMPEVTAAVCS